MAVAASSATTRVTCPSCGEGRYVSSRTARRGAGRCGSCLYPVRRGPVDDVTRRWVLRNFGDADVVEIAEAMFGRRGSVEHVRCERERLLGG